MKPFITEPGIYRELDETVYHADPVIGGSLSSTGAKHLTKSPAHYHHYNTFGMAPRAAFDRGHVIHKEILGIGEEIAVLDFDSFRSKAAQEARDQARTEHRVPILEKDYSPLLEVANTVLDHPHIGPWFIDKPENSEVSIFHKHAEYDVWMRGRIDRVMKDGDTTVLIDVKTTQDADPALFGRTAAKFGYDLQRSWYKTIWEALTGDTVRFLHVLVGLDEPTTLSVVELDDDFDWTGTELMNRALERYAECLRTDEWPGYPPIVHTITPPNYHIYALEDDDAEIEI